jgi:uncharacterized protein (TIGR02001 family)
VPARRLYALGAVLTLLPLGGAGGARAQFAVSATAASDYVYRGLSLSDGQPTLSLNASYDDGSGVYLGGSAIGQATVHAGPQMLGYVEYLGYARRVDLTKTWDIGVTHANYSLYYYRTHDVAYTQIYAGLRATHFSYYVYYSPDYFSEKVQSVYTEVNANARLSRKWRLLGHAGLLTPLETRRGDDSPREQYDLSAGVAAELGRIELQLGVATTGPGAYYLAGHPQQRATAFLSATCNF